MTTRQLAGRIGISQSGVVGLEKGEVQGSVSLSTLQQAAEALQCTLVYALVPNKPLEEMVHDRAAHVASNHLARIHHTMRLENQALDHDDLAAERERLIRELLAGTPRRLWDDQ
jgi:predicted DNA-binding mobile mystery protein A